MTTIYLTLKQMSKRHPYLNAVPIQLPLNAGASYPLENFLTTLVRQQVDVFNQRKSDKSLVRFFTEDQIEMQLSRGKIDFGDPYNELEADAEKAIEVMLQAFKDGLFAVFKGEIQLTQLKDEFSLEAEQRFSFIRLTFLSGSFY